jgi:hypothetical protein
MQWSRKTMKLRAEADKTASGLPNHEATWR